jgi:hypothetical protein
LAEVTDNATTRDRAMTAAAPLVTVIDPAQRRGHSETNVSGLCRALRRRGYRIHLAAGSGCDPARPGIAPDVDQRLDADPDRGLVASARQVRAIDRAALEAGAGFAIDAYFNAHPLAYGVRGLSIPSANMVHRVVCPTHLRQRGRARAEQATMRRLQREGAVFAVHTTRAQEVLADGGIDTVLLRVPIDVQHASGPAPERQEQALFLTGHHQKLQRLVGAVARALPDLRVVTTAREGDPGLPNVAALGRLDRAGLLDEIRRSTMMLIPYSGEFAARGRASSVLAEALACGTPVVVTDELRDQVPAASATVFAAGPSEGAFVEAVRAARQQADPLLRVADEQREEIALAYSFDTYLDGLLPPLGIEPR